MENRKVWSLFGFSGVIVLTLLGFQNCKKNDSSGDSTQNSTSLQETAVTGVHAASILQSLQNVGAANTNSGVGGPSPSVAEIECTAPVVPDAKPSCTARTETSTFNFSDTDSKRVDDALIYVGAVVNDPKNVGGHIARAYDINCTGTVPLLSTANCQMKIIKQ